MRLAFKSLSLSSISRIVIAEDTAVDAAGAKYAGI